MKKELILALILVCSIMVFAQDSNTVLLIHADGTDGSTVFTDSSSSGHTVTAFGNAQVDTTQKVFGTGSAKFDGTRDYLNIPNSSDWDFGSDDFTIDLWLRQNIASNVYAIFMHGDESDNDFLYMSTDWHNNLLYFSVKDNGTYTVRL